MLANYHTFAIGYRASIHIGEPCALDYKADRILDPGDRSVGCYRDWTDYQWNSISSRILIEDFGILGH